VITQRRIGFFVVNPADSMQMEVATVHEKNPNPIEDV
jgi:hypothetical protein